MHRGLSLSIALHLRAVYKKWLLYSCLNVLHHYSMAKTDMLLFHITLLQWSPRLYKLPILRNQDFQGFDLEVTTDDLNNRVYLPTMDAHMIV